MSAIPLPQPGVLLPLHTWPGSRFQYSVHPASKAAILRIAASFDPSAAADARELYEHILTRLGDPAIAVETRFTLSFGPIDVRRGLAAFVTAVLQHFDAPEPIHNLTDITIPVDLTADLSPVWLSIADSPIQPALPLDEFAREFESAFAEFKLAAGEAALWALRRSVKLPGGPLTCYAVRPLWTETIDRHSPATGKDYFHIDLTQWARGFCRAVDETLDDAVRRSLAECIPEGLAPVLASASSQGDLGAARQALTRALSRSLAAWSAPVIVQAPAEVTARAAKDPAQLTGAVSSSAAPKTAWHGEIDLRPGPGSLNFLADLPHPGALAFQATGLRSPDLDFVLPDPPVPFARAARLALPLTVCPQPPTLVSRQLSPDESASTPASIAEALDAALRCTYSVELVHHFAAQDQLYIAPLFDAPPAAPQPHALPTHVAALFDALALFLEALAADAAARVAQAWSRFWSAPAPAPQAAPAARTEFALRPDPASPGTLHVFGRAANGANPAAWPRITPAGSPAWSPDPARAAVAIDSAGWWTLSHAFAADTAFDSLLLEWPGLDPRHVRSAAFAAYVIRNAEFFGAPANPPFVYRSPEVAAGPLVVQVERDALPPLSAAKTLAETLKQVLAAFTTGVPCRIALDAVYSYLVAPEFRASLPVLAGIDIPLTPGADVSPIAAELAAHIAAWRNATKPPSDGAQLILSLTVAGATHPIASIGALPIGF